MLVPTPLFQRMNQAPGPHDSQQAKSSNPIHVPTAPHQTKGETEQRQYWHPAPHPRHSLDSKRDAPRPDYQGWTGLPQQFDPTVHQPHQVRRWRFGFHCSLWPRSRKLQQTASPDGHSCSRRARVSLQCPRGSGGEDTKKKKHDTQRTGEHDMRTHAAFGFESASAAHWGVQRTYVISRIDLNTPEWSAIPHRVKRFAHQRPHSCPLNGVQHTFITRGKLIQRPRVKGIPRELHREARKRRRQDGRNRASVARVAKASA